MIRHSKINSSQNSRCVVFNSKIFALAWRNIWRNKRRSLITASSIAFAVMFAIVMNAIQKGGWDRMLDNVLRYHFGYAQIHEEGYWEEQTLDLSMDYDPALIDSLNQALGGGRLIPRLETFGLISTGTQTQGVMIIGIIPEKEDHLSDLSGRIVKGTYLNESGNVLIGEGIAELLRATVGDTVVMMTQGYQGISAADQYIVGGIVRFGSPDLNKSLVYLSLPDAQYFLGAEERITSLVISLDDINELPKVVNKLDQKLKPTTMELKTWESLIPDLVQARAFDDAGSVIVLLILYLIISFGIFGMVLMMVKERMYEFGVLVAIGLHRRNLVGIIWLELFFLSLIGVIVGMCLAFPVVLYFHHYPIQFTGDMAEVYIRFGMEPLIPAAMNIRLFYNQALIVFFLSLVMITYPMIKIMKLSPVQSMRH